VTPQRGPSDECLAMPGMKCITLIAGQVIEALPQPWIIVRYSSIHAPLAEAECPSFQRRVLWISRGPAPRPRPGCYIGSRLGVAALRAAGSPSNPHTTSELVEKRSSEANVPFIADWTSKQEAAICRSQHAARDVTRGVMRHGHTRRSSLRAAPRGLRTVVRGRRGQWDGWCGAAVTTEGSGGCRVCRFPWRADGESADPDSAPLFLPKSTHGGRSAQSKGRLDAMVSEGDGSAERTGRFGEQEAATRAHLQTQHGGAGQATCGSSRMEVRVRQHGSHEESRAQRRMQGG
jgi:hypothetical protein